MYAISGNANNSIYPTSGDTVYCTPHKEIQEIRHSRNTGCTPYQEMLFIVRHIRKYKKYATSGNTGCTPYQEMLRTIYTRHQEIQKIVRHIRKYKKYVTSGNTRCIPYQEMLFIVRHIRKYHKYVTSGNTVCTPYQDRYVCLKNNICATSGDAIYSTPHQEIQKVRHIRKYRM